MNHRLITSLAVLAVLGAACTSGGTEPTQASTAPATTTTTAKVDSREAANAFLICMGDNGVELDELPLDANGRPRLEMISPRLAYSDPATTSALAICAETLSGGALDLAYDDDFRSDVVEQLSAFSRCLRARGVEGFPDPAPGFIGIGAPYPVAEVPYGDPDLPDAVAACEETVFGSDSSSVD